MRLARFLEALLPSNNKLKAQLPLSASRTLAYGFHRFFATEGSDQTANATGSNTIGSESELLSSTPKTDLLNLRLNVDDIFIGGLIGRGGHVIQNIRKESGCMIKINDFLEKDTSERQIFLSGEQNSVDIAKEMIQARIDILKNEHLETGKNIISKQLLIPNDRIGAIIGYNGNNITRIRDQCKCHVSITRKIVPDTNLRAIIMSGPPDEVDLAMKMIEETLTRIDSNEAV